MKKTILLLFLLLFGFTANAQTLGELSVSSFTRLNQDMDARIREPKKDQNGELAAIIKVITNERDLTFDVGMMGVVEAVQKTGEVWVYVPHSINRISINHPNYKKLSNYSLPESIDQATVYELELDIVNRENFGSQSNGNGMALNSQYFTINYTPADISVEVYIDDEYITTANGGSYSQLLKYGTHTYRLVSPGYNNQAGRIVIGAQKEAVSLDMLPAAGFINFTSTPVSGASVYVDGVLAGVTPFRSDMLTPGEHTVRAIMELYKPFSQVVDVPTDGNSIDVPITLSANYATVNISCEDSESQVFVNNVERGGSSASVRLVPGIYTIEARRDSYRSVFQSIEVVAGVDQSVSLAALQPIYGALNISSSPADATIAIDGVDMGTTPNIIGNLLIGARTIAISKDGYEGYTASVTIADGEVAALNVTLEKKPLYSEEVLISRKAAEQGDARAQYNLGACYYNGRGVTQSYTEAVKWYRKAAEQGDADAQNNLGVCYKNGQGVAQSYTEAVKWYRKAAEQGYADAQNNLGYCCKKGRGVTQSYTEAVKWYRKAAEQGDADAQNNLGYCYKNGQGVAQSYTEAVKWYRKSAEQGNKYAQFNLGICYYSGQGVTQSKIEAVKWYRKAAEQGNKFAQNNLGYCYKNGQGVAQSYTEAVKWYRKSAEQGYADAQCNLGLCYYNGQGVTKSKIEAIKWYRKAAEQGHVNAKKRLKELGED